jgi:hypothetical protein
VFFKTFSSGGQLLRDTGSVLISNGGRAAAPTPPGFSGPVARPFAGADNWKFISADAGANWTGMMPGPRPGPFSLRCPDQSHCLDGLILAVVRAIFPRV